jgi:oligopeptide transport system permease protein
VAAGPALRARIGSAPTAWDAIYSRAPSRARACPWRGFGGERHQLGIGIAYGAVAGYVGGRTDQLMMRFVEMLSGLPLIFFVIFLTVIFGRSPSIAVLVHRRGGLADHGAYRARSNLEHSAARIHRSGGRVRRRHRPHHRQARGSESVGPVIVYATLTMPQIILFESFLSFLGLGVQEPHASLGTLIAEGAGEMEAAPWILLVPGSVLAMLLLCLNIFGDGLRDALDVKER